MSAYCHSKSWSCALSILLLLANAAAAGLKEPIPQPTAVGVVTLRFKATAKEPQIYEMQTRSTNRVVTTTGQSSLSTTSKKTIRRSATAADGGQLSVLLEDGGGTFEVNGQPVLERQPEAPSTGSMVITSTGRTAQGALQVRGEVGGIDFVLPQEPVSVGDSWDATAPQRPDFPIPLRVVFKLRELKQSQGRLFAIVSSTADIDQQLPERHVAVRLKYAGSIAFDVEGGFIAQANNSTTFKLQYLAENLGGLRETETDSRDILKLVPKPAK